MYQKLSWSVFHEHLLIFSFILTVGIQTEKENSYEQIWSLLLTGGISMPKEDIFPKPAVDWISGQSWIQIALSLGQGQGPAAEKLISEGVKSGDWILLQNCHLASSWLPNLVTIWEEIDFQNAHKDFRLWLTSYPSEEFPTSLLQGGVKIALQHPAGIRNNIHSFYKSEFIQSANFYQWKKEDGNGKIETIFHRLVYSLAFFHAVVIERSHFGSQGWNLPYHFSTSDLEVSARQLKSLLAGEKKPPFEALRYLTAECNYGGRIIDQNDRILINSLLKQFYNDQISSGKKRRYLGEVYGYPEDFSIEEVQLYSNNINIPVEPEALGLNSFASVLRNENETKLFLSGVLSTQPQVGMGRELSRLDIVLETGTDLLSKVPDDLLSDLEEKFPTSYHECLNSVLKLEIERYNKLIRLVRTSLKDLMSALKGEIIMSLEIEQTLSKVVRNQLPDSWKKISYESEYELSQYITDLANRVQFLNGWITNGTPNTFWFPGFYFPHSFLTAVLENFARSSKVPVSDVYFRFKVFKPEETVGSATTCITGLHIEGASWDVKSGKLVECRTMNRYTELPRIGLIPSSDTAKLRGYRCPVYMTPRRAGETNTAGHSCNYIFSIHLPTDDEDSHWINRGVAAVCQVPF